MRRHSPAVPFPQGYQKHPKGSCEKQQEQITLIVSEFELNENPRPEIDVPF